MTLKEKISKLDEVTVIAYGTQNKREVIGAMSTVKANEIKDIPSPSLANLLQGRVAGMNVTNMTGAPGGGGTSITIRGFNSLSIESSRRGSAPCGWLTVYPCYRSLRL
ncbi:MAG: TonB-dependent receptor plug domain-containing protein [Butyricimonas faecihominis]